MHLYNIVLCGDSTVGIPLHFVLTSSADWLDIKGRCSVWRYSQFFGAATGSKGFHIWLSTSKHTWTVPVWICTFFYFNISCWFWFAVNCFAKQNQHRRRLITYKNYNTDSSIWFADLVTHTFLFFTFSSLSVCSLTALRLDVFFFKDHCNWLIIIYTAPAANTTGNVKYNISPLCTFSPTCQPSLVCSCGRPYIRLSHGEGSIDKGDRIPRAGMLPVFFLPITATTISKQQP